MQQRSTFPEDPTDDTAAPDDIETSFHRFRSNTTVTSTKLKELANSNKDLQKSSENLPNLPKTPSPSITAVEKKISSNTPFQKFPLSPEKVSSKEESIVKSYLSGSDRDSMFPAVKSSKITKRNPGEVNALLKAVYSISNADSATLGEEEAAKHGTCQLNQTKVMQEKTSKIDDISEKVRGSKDHHETVM